MGRGKLLAFVLVLLTLVGTPAEAVQFQVGAFSGDDNARDRVRLLEKHGFEARLSEHPDRLTKVITPELNAQEKDRLGRFLQAQDIDFIVLSKEPEPSSDQTLSDTGFKSILSQLNSAYRTRISEGLMDKFNSVMGTDYVWGGESLDEGGFDCSGLLYWGLDYDGMPRTVKTMWNWTNPVPEERIQAGDFIYFRFDSTDEPDHVGLYLGDDTFIHASSSYGVIKANFEKDYYQRNLHGIGRPPSP